MIGSEEEAELVDACVVALVAAREIELVILGTKTLMVTGFVPGARAIRLITASFVPFIGADKIILLGQVANAISCFCI